MLVMPSISRLLQPMCQMSVGSSNQLCRLEEEPVALCPALYVQV